MSGGSAVVKAGSEVVKAGSAVVKAGSAYNPIKGVSEAGKAFQCRSSFTIEAGKLNFYPGHMNRGLKKMQSRLGRVDCFLEVHDARIPFSGRNPQFYEKLTAIRPHVVVFNKSDLADSSMNEEIRHYLMLNEPHLADVIWTNSKIQYSKSIKAIMPQVHQAIDRHAFHTLKSDRNIMVLGVPNCGKSSVINALRRVTVQRGKAVPTGDQPGITRALQERVKLDDNPPTYCFDTPGVLHPSVHEVENGMRLAACGAFKDSEIGIENIVDYLLYFMNKREMFHYVQYFGLEEPTDELFILLNTIARNLKFKKTMKVFSSGGGRKVVWDTFTAANYFLGQYRKGNLGTFILDDDKLDDLRGKYSSRLRIAGNADPYTIDAR